MNIKRIRNLAMQILKECEKGDKAVDTRNLRQRQEDNTRIVHDNKREIISDYKRGLSLRAISKKYGVTNSNMVSHVLDKWKVRKRKNR